MPCQQMDLTELSKNCEFRELEALPINVVYEGEQIANLFFFK